MTRGYEYDPDKPTFIEQLNPVDHLGLNASVGNIIDGSPDTYTAREWLYQTQFGIYDLSLSRTHRSKNHPDSHLPENNISVSFQTINDANTKIDFSFTDDQDATLYYSQTKGGTPVRRRRQVVPTNQIVKKLSSFLAQLRSSPGGNTLAENQCSSMIDSLYDSMNADSLAVKPATKPAMETLLSVVKGMITDIPEEWVSRLSTYVTHNEIIPYEKVTKNDDAEHSVGESATIKRYSNVSIASRLQGLNPGFRSTHYPAELIPEHTEIHDVITHIEKSKGLELYTSLLVCADGTVRDYVAAIEAGAAEDDPALAMDNFKNALSQGVTLEQIERFQDFCADVTRIIQRND